VYRLQMGMSTAFCPEQRAPGGSRHRWRERDCAGERYFLWPCMNEQRESTAPVRQGNPTHWQHRDCPGWTQPERVGRGAKMALRLGKSWLMVFNTGE
jgi:hypothetical protein